jgi:hypothetical protein
MKSMKRVPPAIMTVLIVIFVATNVLVLGAWGKRRAAKAKSAAQPSFTISSTPPTELNAAGGGPAKATLQQAAEFAWEEFFALSWPAGPQNGQPSQRDTPSSTCALGDQSAACAGPLVWQTYRGKVEIFPGDGNPPPGYSATAPSYGYDALPQYHYKSTVPACQNPTPLSGTAWINLDETDQITLDSMYAGIVTIKPSSLNSAPQLIRFLAKANRAEYTYIAGNKWWDGSAPTGVTAQYVKTNKQDPPNGTSYVLLPNNSIEIKAGWRVLNPSEMTSGKFHMATVRYYEPGGGTTCYQQATFGLVSLHIIQKTPMAPYFIYASFEQADNILDAKGNDVEDVNGAVLPPLAPCRSDQQAPCPTTPSVTLNDTATVNPPTNVPPQVVLVPSTAAYCTSGTTMTPPNRLFYLNTEGLPALPTKGYICINQRDNDIPPVIIDTNQQAHTLIQSYSAQHGIKNSVWQYYKLVNVQYLPIDKEHAGLYGTQPGENNPADAHNPNSYYLANIVVETNRSLQLFSGGLVNSGTTGANSDYDSQFGGSGTTIHHNMFYQGSGYNMGGCMGCHGSQGQTQGGDFSVIVANGPVRKPEIPAPPTANGAALVFRNRHLK